MKALRKICRKGHDSNARHEACVSSRFSSPARSAHARSEPRCRQCQRARLRPGCRRTARAGRADRESLHHPRRLPAVDQRHHHRQQPAHRARAGDELERGRGASGGRQPDRAPPGVQARPAERARAEIRTSGAPAPLAAAARAGGAGDPAAARRTDRRRTAPALRTSVPLRRRRRGGDGARAPGREIPAAGRRPAARARHQGDAPRASARWRRAGAGDGRGPGRWHNRGRRTRADRGTRGRGTPSARGVRRAARRVRHLPQAIRLTRPASSFPHLACPMLIHPQFDPIAFSLGPLSVRWYGLMYLIAFVLFVVLGRLHARRRPELGWNAQMIDVLPLYGVIGVIVGGRLGEVLFFQPGYYLQHPGEILAVWKGGMSFHGGFLGVLVVMWVYGRKHGKGFWQVTDFIAPLVPTGLAAGRVGNFINGELWGRPVDGELPWAMVFPWVDAVPRHPSQLYQAAGEGLLLFVILWFYAASPRPLRAVSAVFLIGYGSLRFVAEFFRTPDPGIFGTLALGLSTAQWLCVPMVVVGGLTLTLAARGTQR